MDIKDKIAVVTGATGGMGAEITKNLSAKEVFLILLARDETKVKEQISKLAHPEKCKFYLCDVSDPTKFEPVLKQISTDYPTIDFLINLAGIGVYKPLEELEVSEWINSFNINVHASFLTMKTLIESLKKSSKAKIINMGSGMGKLPTPKRSAYCASKFALRGLTLSLAREFEGTNIQITHMDMGSVLTEFGPLSLEDKQKENLEGKPYLTPQFVGKKIAEILESDSYMEEITLYPSDYEKVTI